MQRWIEASDLRPVGERLVIRVGLEDGELLFPGFLGSGHLIRICDSGAIVHLPFIHVA
jgi:hypothetical protein